MFEIKNYQSHNGLIMCFKNPIQYLFIILTLVFTSCSHAQIIDLIQPGMEIWHTDVPDADTDPNIAPSFVFEDGMLTSMGRPLGHLITNDSYKSYRIEAEYRFPEKPGNCGILVHASTPRALYDMFPQSIEVQMEHTNAGDFWVIQEDITVDNMVQRRGPKQRWGGGERNERRIKKLTENSEKPLGEWNRMVIECVGDEIKVWVNGDMVNHGYDATVSEGQIAVQAEGAKVEFRKLTLEHIAELSKD